jgi:exosortase H (IPTLxxWG-CTERM-specific)
MTRSSARKKAGAATQVAAPEQTAGLFPLPAGGPRFLARFCAIALGLFALLYVATDSETAWLTHAEASTVLALLHALGMHARLDGPRLAVPGFSASVVDQCTAVYESALLVAAILAFPAAARKRAWGIGIGLLGLAVLNLMRITSLFVVGAWLPEWFTALHLYAWQAIVAAAVLAFWLGWITGTRENA